MLTKSKKKTCIKCRKQDATYTSPKYLCDYCWALWWCDGVEDPERYVMQTLQQQVAEGHKLQSFAMDKLKEFEIKYGKNISH